MTGSRGKRSRAVLWLFLAGGVGVVAPAEAGSSEPEKLFRHYCASCHGLTGAGDGSNADFLDPPPRNLTKRRYVARLTDDDLRNVIAHGGASVGKSKLMPPWGRTLSAEQVEALVLYVRSLPSRASAPDRAEPLREKGLRLVKELGCTGCHRIGDLRVTPVAPDLGGIGGKINRPWLVRFLKAPHRIRPVGYVPLTGSRMPNFRLTDDEAEDLADYLMSLEPVQPAEESLAGATHSSSARGEELYRESGCQACHALKGVGGRVGPDLTRLGERLKPEWVAGWIRNPQALDEGSPMPNFGLSAKGSRAIAQYLGAAGKDVPPAKTTSPARVEAGRRRFSDLGCGGCHLVAAPWRPVRVGPDLTYEGDKVKHDWLTDFLLHPSSIRPWLEARMPDFELTESETRAIAAYLETLQDPGVPALPEKFRVPGTPASVAAGRMLVSRDYFSCETCHPVGSRLPEGEPVEWGPNLAISGRRLRPEWIIRWLLDPHAIQQGTRMPNFFNDSTSGPEDVLGGDEDRHILALRDFLISLGEGPTAASERR